MCRAPGENARDFLHRHKGKPDILTRVVRAKQE